MEIMHLKWGSMWVQHIEINNISYVLYTSKYHCNFGLNVVMI